MWGHTGVSDAGKSVQSVWRDGCVSRSELDPIAVSLGMWHCVCACGWKSVRAWGTRWRGRRVKYVPGAARSGTPEARDEPQRLASNGEPILAHGTARRRARVQCHTQT